MHRDKNSQVQRLLTKSLQYSIVACFLLLCLEFSLVVSWTEKQGSAASVDVNAHLIFSGAHKFYNMKKTTLHKNSSNSICYNAMYITKLTQDVSFQIIIVFASKKGNNGNTNKFLDIRCNVSKLIVKTSYPISLGFIAPLCTCKLFPYMKITDNLDKIYQNITMLHLRSVLQL